MLNLTDLSLLVVSSELGWARGEWPVSLALPTCLPRHCSPPSIWHLLVMHMMLIQAKVGYLP